MFFSLETENTVSTLRMRYGLSRPYIYIAAITFVMMAFISLPMVTVDVSSQSAGVVRAKNDNTNITSIVSGRVVKANITNNKSVKSGDTLMVIDNSAIMTHAEEQQRLSSEIGQRIHDLILLCQGKSNGLQTSLYVQEWAEYTTKMQNLYEICREKERDYELARQGYDEGVLSKKDYDQTNDAMQAVHRDIADLRQQQISVWQNDLQQLREKQHSLIGELRQSAQQRLDYVIVSPTDGTLLSESAVSVGSFVTAGQLVASVSPDDSLIVECYVSPSDIGFIAIGQEVKLQFTAFDYNQWGFGQAVVSDINHNIIMRENKPFFIVHCKMKEHKLMLKNGYEAVIKKGMTLTGRFLITRRTLWHLLWDKVDDWFNPKQQFGR